jgi:hypothetical protein
MQTVCWVLGAAGQPGVVVIVLPTKALVNQLAAQVGPML